MILFWTGIFFLSSSGLFLYPIYASENMEFWPYALGIGIVLGILGCWRTSGFRCLSSNEDPIKKQGNPPAFTWKTGLFLIPVVLGIYAFRFPYDIPLYVLAAGIILTCGLQRCFLRFIGEGVIFSGLVLSFQTACIVPYFKFAARYHDINVFTPFFYWILKCLGIPCSYSQETLFVQTSQANLSLVTSWEKLGLFSFITIFVGAIVLFYFVYEKSAQSGILKKIGILFLAMIVFTVARYVFLSLGFVETTKAEIFWKPIIVAGTFFPLPFILWYFTCYKINPHQFLKNTQGQNASEGLNTKEAQRKSENVLDLKDGFSVGAQISQSVFQRCLPGIVMFVFSFALISCFWFQDPGEMKKGRILIDENYSNWEWTDRVFDTEWFGIQSVYNYYCFADYLKYFYTVDRLREAITEERLKNCDVFIVKTPTSPFSKDEINIIEQYVLNGGGLFLIGDHTNVFGTTININPLAARFGVRFEYDATYDLIDNDLHFHAQNRLFRHPSIKDMPYFLFATSCSMTAPFFTEDSIIASNLKAIYLDYARGGYFPDKSKELNYTFGLFLQSTGLKFGKGRVMAFSDSTCFSNFYMHIPGKPEYALGSINWLNRTNRHNYTIKIVSLFVMALAFGYLVYLFLVARRRELNKPIEVAQSQFEDCIISRKRSLRLSIGSFARVLVFSSLLGAASGVLLFDFLAEKSYALPKEHTRTVKVGFEEGYCDFQIPSRRLLHKPEIDYQTFYVWPQRLGYIPTLFSFNDNAGQFDMVIMVNPQKYFSESDLKNINDYVEDGGKLLIIDSPKGKLSTANQLVGQFGLKAIYDQFQEKANVIDGAETIGTLSSFSPITGGASALLTSDGKACVSVVKKGKGMVAFAAISTSFTNKEMGETESVPDEHQHFLYKLEFWLLSSLINGEFKPYSSFAVSSTETQ